MHERNKEKHEYDILNVTKSIKKRLFKKMKKKDCFGLADWTKAITDHRWWSAKNCDGEEKKLRESLLCLLYHTVNKHCWKIGKKWYKCNCVQL